MLQMSREFVLAWMAFHSLSNWQPLARGTSPRTSCWHSLRKDLLSYMEKHRIYQLASRLCREPSPGATICWVLQSRGYFEGLQCLQMERHWRRLSRCA